MRPHDHAGRPRLDRLQGLPSLGRTRRAGQQHNRRSVNRRPGSQERISFRERTEESANPRGVLGRENLRRCQQNRLAARSHDVQHRANGNNRLPTTDISLQQPLHGYLSGEIGGDFVPHRRLSAGQGEGQARIEGLPQG